MSPVGPERAKIVVRLCIMSVFVVFIHFVMTALRMSEEETAFGTEAVVTLVAVIVPSMIANLQSAEERELEKERQTFRVKKIVEDFLAEDVNRGKFYREV